MVWLFMVLVVALFYSSETDGIEFVCIVTAYHANRLTGDTLPGLLAAQDVSHFHCVIQTIKTMDKARRKKALEVTQPPQIPKITEVAKA